jgi:hypothetical protein
MRVSIVFWPEAGRLVYHVQDSPGIVDPEQLSGAEELPRVGDIMSRRGRCFRSVVLCVETDSRLRYAMVLAAL